MSRAQVKHNLFTEITDLIRRVTALELISNTPRLPIVNSTGMTSAQIDAAVFGGQQQPFDGAQAADTTNSLVLVRESGKWRKITTVLIP